MRCEFCGQDYRAADAAAACGGCPLRRGCAKTRCPHCGYEAVRTPRWLGWLARQKAAPNPADNGDCHRGSCTLAALAPGSEGRIAGLDGADQRTVRRLMAMGLSPGATVRVVRATPGVVVKTGFCEMALDRETAAKVRVARV